MAPCPVHAGTPPLAFVFDRSSRPHASLAIAALLAFGCNAASDSASPDTAGSGGASDSGGPSTAGDDAGEGGDAA
ncbi:MAG: hypothetical protein AAF721_37380, partial [Myxococcota bacterium]